MRIGIAGPMSLDLIKHPFDINKLPIGYPFPPMSQFVNGFLDEGHKVIAFTYSTGINEPIVLESENITICIAKRRSGKAARDFFKEETKQLIELMNSYDLDILAPQWSYEFSLAALKTKHTVTMRMRDYPPKILKLNKHPYQFIRTLIHYYNIRKAKYINVNSEYLFAELPNYAKKKSVVIPNFYNSDIVDSKIKKKKKNYVVCVSNGFKGCKNILSLLISFKEIKKVQENISLFLIGAGLEQYSKGYKLAEKKGLIDGVEFLGKKSYPETLDLIANAKLMIHPSLEESFGMSVLESMVLGTTVIGGKDSGNIPFLLDKGRAGFLVDVQNPKSIAETAIKVLNDDDLREKIETEAKKYANENFSQDVVIKKFIKYFEGILNK